MPLQSRHGSLDPDLFPDLLGAGWFEPLPPSAIVPVLLFRCSFSAVVFRRRFSAIFCPTVAVRRIMLLLALPTRLEASSDTDVDESLLLSCVSHARIVYVKAYVRVCQL
jgi:hypothetical protein